MNILQPFGCRPFQLELGLCYFVQYIVAYIEEYFIAPNELNIRSCLVKRQKSDRYFIECMGTGCAQRLGYQFAPCDFYILVDEKLMRLTLLKHTV